MASGAASARRFAPHRRAEAAPLAQKVTASMEAEYTFKIKKK